MECGVAERERERERERGMRRGQRGPRGVRPSALVMRPMGRLGCWLVGPSQVVHFSFRSSSRVTPVRVSHVFTDMGSGTGARMGTSM